MVSVTHQQQQQQPQQQSQPVTAPVSVEEEALKRNTDCVYFLASPLTCKKGSECEYRHSEYARVNPRDCWFWLNGNCLNPKCSYRHPPLDALLGTQVATPSGSSLVPPTAAAAVATHATYNSGKQAVPCIFFQKGYCSKGDKCSFSHGPNPVASKIPVPPPVATPVTEAQPLKKVFGVLQKCTQEQKIPQSNISKPVQPPFVEAKPAAKIGAVPPKNGVGLGKRAPPPIESDDEIPRYEPTNVLPLANGNSVSRSHRIHQTHVLDDLGLQNDKDADDYLRESSPGFDVLVDDDVNESDYYHNEGMNLTAMNEYDSMADVNPEVFRDSRGYDSYERLQGGQYGWEQRRASSERVLTGSSHMERRVYKDRSPDEIYESDLRHQLSKQRKGSGNGLRSVINSDYDRDRRVDGRSYRSSHSQRDSDRDHNHRSPPQESSVSSRLWGRIKLPGRSGIVDGGEVRNDRHWGRVSPGRPQVSSHQGRLRDRIKGRTHEDFSDEGRNHLRNGGPRMRREFMDERITDFSGPKSLAELKGGKQRNHRVEDYQPSEGDLSFEGPKPLSLILKRKREAGGSNNEESDMSSKTTTEQKPSNLVLGSKVETEEEEGFVETKKHKSSHVETSQEAGELENEEGMIVEEGIEDENRDDGDYDYEHGDEEVTEFNGDEEVIEFNGDEEGNEYNGDEEGENAEFHGDEEGTEFQVDEEGEENADVEEEYLDDEDDFAKKMGVMFS